MGLEKQGSKPTGLIGKIIGRMMNTYHTKRYTTYFDKNQPPDNATILNIGCGGGNFLKYLSEMNSSYRFFGLDHSPEMVLMSKKVNRKVIEQRRMEIINGSVMHIPLKDASIDLVTAFETVHFWPDIQKSFSEIYRVLNKDGRFVIMNIFPKAGTRWWELVKMKTETDFIQRLKASGFEKVKTDLEKIKGWIVVESCKN